MRAAVSDARTSASSADRSTTVRSQSAVLRRGNRTYREGMKNVFFVLLMGCTTSESSSLLTKGITADMIATTTGAGTTHVSAELFEGDPLKFIYVDLQAGDTLVADFNGQSMTMTKSELLNIISYDAEFQSGNAGDEFSIDFQRAVDDGAPLSTTTLPAAFALDPVAATQSRASDLIITYAPSQTTDQITWDASGDCIQTKTGAVATDTGTITIPANTLTGTTTCTVTVSVYRQQGGTVDAHYEGGDFPGAQARTATFSSTP
jgi:hypothetical protein